MITSRWTLVMALALLGCGEGGTAPVQDDGDAGLRVTTASLPRGLTNTPYVADLVASGGAGGYRWSVLAGALPNGVALDPSGRISGSTLDVGESSVLFSVTSLDAAQATRQLTLSMDQGPPVVRTLLFIKDCLIGCVVQEGSVYWAQAATTFNLPEVDSVWVERCEGYGQSVIPVPVSDCSLEETGSNPPYRVRLRTRTSPFTSWHEARWWVAYTTPDGR